MFTFDELCKDKLIPIDNSIYLRKDGRVYDYQRKLYLNNNEIDGLDVMLKLTESESE